MFLGPPSTGPSVNPLMLRAAPNASGIGADARVTPAGAAALKEAFSVTRRQGLAGSVTES